MPMGNHKYSSDIQSLLWRYNIRSYPVLNDDGEVGGVVEFSSDITERKRAEEGLQQSEAKFRELFNSAGDAIFILDLEGRFLEVNQAACDHNIAIQGEVREQLLELIPYSHGQKCHPTGMVRLITFLQDEEVDSTGSL